MLPNSSDSIFTIAIILGCIVLILNLSDGLRTGEIHHYGFAFANSVFILLVVVAKRRVERQREQHLD